MKEMILKESKGVQVTNEVIKSFLDYIDVSNNSILTYGNALKQFKDYLQDNNISVPNRQNIIEYRDYLMQTYTPKTVNVYLSSIKNLFSWLEYNDICKDITKNVKMIKVGNEHLKRGLTKEEIKQVLSNCSNIREELIIKLMITCALRVNEVCNIQINDFYNDSGIIMLKVLGKGRDYKQDSVKIDDRILELIKKYSKEYNVNDYLFYSTSNHNKKGKINPITIRRIVTNLFKKSDIDMDRISPHSTRHSACEIALESGTPLQEVSEFMRHKNIQTTLVYSKEIERKNCNIANNITNLIMGE